MPKDYYLILGVASSASADEIKTAFRRRARELHPDRSGLESGPFLEVQEAYGVLGDPERRRTYDLQRRAVAVRRRPWGPSPEPLMRPPRGEPFRSSEPELNSPIISIGESFGHCWPSFDEMFERLWSNFEHISRPKSEAIESLTVELVLGAGEARRGGAVTVLVPARATCLACGGAGAFEVYECWRCQGQGTLVTEYPVQVSFPPGVRDGAIVQIALDSFGVENFYLSVLFRVGTSD